MDNLERLKHLYELEKDIEKKKRLILNQVEFINPLKVGSGVYQIEDFYVGRSGNFKERILSHVREVITNAKKGNISKVYLIAERLRVGKLRVTILDADQEKEPSYINDRYNKLPLVNVEFVTAQNVGVRKSAHKKLAKGKEITVTTEHFLNNVVASTKIEGKLFFKIGKSVTATKKSLLAYLGHSSRVKKEKPKGKDRLIFSVVVGGNSALVEVIGKKLVPLHSNCKISRIDSEGMGIYNSKLSKEVFSKTNSNKGKFNFGKNALGIK